VSRDGHDAVVVGAGPNGLVAAITLARSGRRVVVFESASTAGGGTRSAALTEPGFVHDVCSTVHAIGVASPAFADLDLEAHGVEWVHPPIPVAHPLDGGRAAILHRDVDETASAFGRDDRAYRRLFAPLVRNAPGIVDDLLSPLGIPHAPVAGARFGLHAIRSAAGLVTARFDTDEPRALLAGAAAHAIQPLTGPGTAGYGLFLLLLAHASGWPVARGGSQRIADALVAVLRTHGGEVVTDHEVTDLAGMPPAPITLLDVTPRQFLRIAGARVPARYARRLERFRYGPGVCKVDWALSEPIPWAHTSVRAAGTVHVCGTAEEVARAEAEVHAGRHADRPYVIVVQPTVMDPTRAPDGGHVGWAYCHVPNGSTEGRTDAIEAQIERFAPGFRDVVTARHTVTAASLEAYDANYVGGDINGGAGDLRQVFTRPVASPHPWATPLDGVYLCSSSTPPGGGVHGMCGLHAARLALRRAERRHATDS
jgi:phytoene dehydrogenase-like protein